MCIIHSKYKLNEKSIISELALDYINELLTDYQGRRSNNHCDSR